MSCSENTKLDPILVEWSSSFGLIPVQVRCWNWRRTFDRSRISRNLRIYAIEVWMTPTWRRFASLFFCCRSLAVHCILSPPVVFTIHCDTRLSSYRTPACMTDWTINTACLNFNFRSSMVFVVENFVTYSQKHYHGIIGVYLSASMTI
jgi:hypothetical protein